MWSESIFGGSELGYPKNIYFDPEQNSQSLLDGMAHVTIYSYGYPATSCMYKAGTAPTCDIEEDKSIYAILNTTTAHLERL